MAKTYSKTKDCPETSDELVICMKDIAVAYQSTVAIFDINLDVYKNEFLGICGPNGSGKSTLLKTMVGVLKPFRGKVRVFGRNIIKDTQMTDLRVRLGYLPQLEAIDRNFPALVKDVVAMGLYAQKGLFKRLDENDEEKIYQALEIVELEDFAQRPIGHLSGGQQQKALLARAIVNEPEILFLDEPTSSLDVKVSKNVMEVIQKIRQKTKSTIVMATHDLNFIKQSCTRSLCLYKRIIWKGDPEEDEFNKVITKVFQA